MGNRLAIAQVSQKDHHRGHFCRRHCLMLSHFLSDHRKKGWRRPE
jgi:hypothetical protein